MKYIVIFHYMDGETFQIEVAASDMERFMETTGKGEVYFNEPKGVGVWVAIEKIRFFKVERVDEFGNRVVITEPEEEKDD